MARQVTGWVGWVWFGAFAILALGLTNIITGLVAVFGTDHVLAMTTEGVAVIDVQTWGWVHVIIGALLVLVGFALFTGSAWARLVAIVLVTLNLLAQFVSLPVTPWWSVVVIALDVLVLWALIVHGAEVERDLR